MKITLRELRGIIREAVREEMMEEGFIDTLKRGVATAAVGASLMFPSSAAANVPSGGDTYSAQEAPEEDRPFVIEDEQGNPHNFYLVTYVRVDGKHYAAMVLEEEMDKEQPMFYLFEEIKHKGGVVEFISVEDDAEFERVKAAVEEKLDSEEEGEEEITLR